MCGDINYTPISPKLNETELAQKSKPDLLFNQCQSAIPNQTKPSVYRYLKTKYLRKYSDFHSE